MATLHVSLRPRATVGILAVLAVGIVGSSLVLQLLAAAYGADHIFGLLPMLNIDREGNVPSWFSSFLLTFAALLAWSLASRSANSVVSGERTGWIVIACLLLFMSLDEGAQVHERAGDLIQPLLPDWGIFYFGWVAIALVGLLLAAPFLVRFVVGLRPRTRWGLVASGCVFLAGALGIEMVTGQYMSIADNKMSLPYFALSHAEELLEMTGVVLLVRTLLLHAEQTDSTGHSSTSERSAVLHG